jgi:hypothetical protein
VKRLIILLLLAVLPVQATWAGAAHCPRGEQYGDHAVQSGTSTGPDAVDPHMAVPDAHHGHHDGDHGNAGHSNGTAVDCSLFQFVAVAPRDTAPHLLPQPSAFVIGIVLPGYDSHIPDGPERPNWRVAA